MQHRFSTTKISQKLVALALVGIMLGACSTKSHKVMPMRQDDKQLSCTDVELEINEAKYYIRQAEENKGVNVKNLLGPWTYLGTYMSAAGAIDAAEQRIVYLNQVHEIRKCDQQQYVNAPQPMQPQQVAYQQTAAMYQQPTPYQQQAAYQMQQAYMAAPVMPVQMMAPQPQYQYAPMAAHMQAPQGMMRQAMAPQQGYYHPAR